MIETVRMAGALTANSCSIAAQRIDVDRIPAQLEIVGDGDGREARGLEQIAFDRPLEDADLDDCLHADHERDGKRDQQGQPGADRERTAQFRHAGARLRGRGNGRCRRGIHRSACTDTSCSIVLAGPARVAPVLCSRRVPIGRAANGWIFRSTPPDCEVDGCLIPSEDRVLTRLAGHLGPRCHSQCDRSCRMARRTIRRQRRPRLPNRRSLGRSSTSRRPRDGWSCRPPPMRTSRSSLRRMRSSGWGRETLPAAELASHRGRKAKVRYTQTNGRRTAHWVVISSDPPRARSSSGPCRDKIAA